MMDGFAVHADDVESAAPDAPVRLQITGEAGCSDANGREGPHRGEAWTVTTGTPVPDRADGVVPVEWTRTPSDEAENSIDVIRPLRKSNIAPPGEDLPAGRRVLSQGTKLRSSELGLLAALGIERVSVYRRPRVALLVTGDEIVAPGRPLAPGQVYTRTASPCASRWRRRAERWSMKGIVVMTWRRSTAGSTARSTAIPT